MICRFCQAENQESAEGCVRCRRALSDLPDGSILAGRYEIAEVIGRGSMGSVHKAKDRVLDETVALKVLRPHFARSPEIAQRFRSEIKLARRVRHPNVCAIHEYGETDGVRYISMEYVDGMNLRRKIQEGSGLPHSEAIDLGLQILSGLEAVHDTGIIHRDLKTPNIMVDRSGRVRLMDFGLAKQRVASEGAVATAIGQVMGTPEFMSPEQVRGERADFPSDIYALGIVFYEMFTGEVPFKGSAAETMVNHVHKPVTFEGPVGSRIPPTFVPVLGQALAKAASDRYATARGMATAIRHAAAVAKASEPGTSAPMPTGPGLRTAAPAPPVASMATLVPTGYAVPGADGSRGPDLQVEVQALIGALRDADPSARRRAAQALGECGPTAREAVGPLITALSDQDFWVSETAALALRKITGAPDPAAGHRRQRSAEASAPTPPAVERLLKAIQDPASRWMAVVALGQMGPAAHEAIPALIEALEDAECAVRWDAAKALGKMGVVAARAVPALTAVLHEQDDAIARQHVVAALGAIGPAARTAVPALMGSLKEDGHHLEEEAGEALVRIGAAAIPALIEAMKDDDPVVRLRAAHTLTRMASGGPAA
jgi:HEAT repeat protein/tRNA A-37 threonylcarbamoyl transferase component Bud32